MPAHTEPHIITRPPQYPSTVREDVESEVRYPILEAAHCPVKLLFQFRVVRLIPAHFQSLDDKNEAVTHITTQYMHLTLLWTVSRISLTKALTTQ